jgi:hypothetical protein
MATLMTTRDRFEIHYANGKIELATSLEDARQKVAHEASAPRMHGLLPATILTRPSHVIGIGEPVRRSQPQTSKPSARQLPTSTGKRPSISAASRAAGSLSPTAEFGTAVEMNETEHCWSSLH